MPNLLTECMELTKEISENRREFVKSKFPDTSEMIVKKTWSVVIYDKDEKILSEWEIKYKTEEEAEKEVIENLVKYPNYNDWSMKEIQAQIQSLDTGYGQGIEAQYMPININSYSHMNSNNNSWVTFANKGSSWLSYEDDIAYKG